MKLGWTVWREAPWKMSQILRPTPSQCRGEVRRAGNSIFFLHVKESQIFLSHHTSQKQIHSIIHQRKKCMESKKRRRWWKGKRRKEWAGGREGGQREGIDLTGVQNTLSVTLSHSHFVDTLETEEWQEFYQKYYTHKKIHTATTYKLIQIIK